MKLATLKPGMLGCDTWSPLSDKGCFDLTGAGIRFVFRYLDNLTAAELAMILDHGLIALFIHSCRDAGWLPKGADGVADGVRDERLLRALGVPLGVHMSFDLEGVGFAAPPSDIMAHVNGHGQQILKGGDLPALYMGVQNRLTAYQAYSLVSRLYWRSCSYIDDEPACGMAMVQAYPPNQIVGSTTIDWDYPLVDYKGRSFIGVSA